MIIKAFGLFWRADEIEWEPGSGNKNMFDLAGRNGVNRPGLRVVDFRVQKGVYILHGNHGVYYVGLTKEQTLGKRLGDHRKDHHTDKWDRFSWFGFLTVLKSRDARGFHKLKKMPSRKLMQPSVIIGDIEALLIKATGAVGNVAQMNFADADEWEQIKRDERDLFFGRVQES